MTGLLRAANLKRYLRSMAQRGFSDVPVLRGTGINPADLDDSDYLIELFQCQKVITNMLTLTGSSSLGLEIGAELSYRDLGIVGHVMASASKVGAASQLWATYSPLLAGIPIEVTLKDAGHPWCFAATGQASVESAFIFSVDELLMASKIIGEKITGHQCRFNRLEFSFSPPPHAARYNEIFACPVRFNQPSCQFFVSSPRIDADLQGSDSLSNEIYLDYCRTQIRKLGVGSSFQARIRAILIKNSRSIPTESEVAQRLHYGTRNMRRLLQLEGLSYRQIVSEFRCELAKEYVATSRMSSQEISFLLGYKENKSFLRAFKAWTGGTVGEYRARTLHPGTKVTARGRTNT